MNTLTTAFLIVLLGAVGLQSCTSLRITNCNDPKHTLSYQNEHIKQGAQGIMLIQKPNKKSHALVIWQDGTQFCGKINAEGLPQGIWRLFNAEGWLEGEYLMMGNDIGSVAIFDRHGHCTYKSKFGISF